MAVSNQNRLHQGTNWYPHNYAGVKISIPIFDGFQNQRTKRAYELQLESARLTTEKLKKDYTHNAQTTRTTLLNDQQDMNNQQNNLNSANDLYKIDMDRLQKGAIKLTALTTMIKKTAMSNKKQKYTNWFCFQLSDNLIFIK